MFTIYRFAQPDAPYTIYPSSMLALGYGYALWHPEPHKTGEPQIGDVGYIREGAFIRLFNINTGALEHEVKHWPTRFKLTEALPSDVFIVDERQPAIGPGRYPSHGVQKKGLELGVSAGPTPDASASLRSLYTCKEVQGALLDLKSAAYAESLYNNPQLLRYMSHEHNSWCAYAQTSHFVKPEEVVLVMGWVKAPPDWATAAFSNRSSHRELSLKGQIGQFVGLKVSGWKSKATDLPTMERHGAKYPKGAGENHSVRDQCVFVKRLKIKKRLWIVPELSAGAGYDDLPDSTDDSDTVGGVQADAPDYDVHKSLFDEGPGDVIDPLDILLDYILEVSEATHALARDEDIEVVLGGDACPLDFSTYLRQRGPPVIVDNSCGVISVPDLVYREWVQMENRKITAYDLRKWPKISERGSGSLALARMHVPNKERPGDQVQSKSTYLEFSDANARNTDASCRALSRDGSLLAASWGTTYVSVWRTSDGFLLQILRTRGHTDSVASVHFSPSKRQLISGSHDRTAIVWDIASGEPVMHLQGHTHHVLEVAFSPDGKHIITGSADYVVKFWDAKTGDPLCSYATDSAVRKFVFSRDGLRLAAVLERSVALYDVRGPIAITGSISPHDLTDYRAVAWSPQSDRILVCAQGLAGRVYDSNSLAELHRFETPKISVAHAVITPDGDDIAVISLEKRRATLALHDAADNRVIFNHKIRSGGNAVAFSPDGTLLVAAGELNVVVWNAKTGALVAEMSEMLPQVAHVEFLPDSRRVLFSGRMGPICVWNVADSLRIR